MMLAMVILAWSVWAVLTLGRGGRAGDYARTCLTVLLFEVLTQPLWSNVLEGAWAYLFKDVSWLLTLAWANVIVTATAVASRLYRGSERANFALTIVLASALGLILEGLLVAAGVRRYPDLLAAGHFRLGKLPGTGVPIEALYYLPVFLGLVTGLARFWSLPDRGELTGGSRA